ncbi:GNAT family N-acetyltransferase [Nocardioides lianchengensis]|uniref:Ribosomal protein S18 acetylase RimI n=1 Tax=Nocardioides lianchengensis TaxID=1045774 RepID=A0A1G7B777_9ACTN|nr:GNAT family N-acetyltransferase [Nocardioides lianchengensis]NYG10095.1 GNAT superfamily N-acetyltransferase [Nocardioides lianchengensis]SDE22710.1 Ribosomal protein S18 acetylase RimI [Nocardioides lianchengensis]
MRLTNVAHLRLPFGRLWGYDLEVRGSGDLLPVSFDQRRHVGAGDRPGSWMALSFRLSAPVARDDLAAAWLAVVERHGTLRSAFVPGPDGLPALRAIEVAPGGWTEHAVASGQAPNDALRAVLDDACSPYRRPSHRLCVLETATGPTVVIAADHAHVDMWSMLVVARDLLQAYGEVRGGRSPALTPVPAFAEHTRALRARPSAPPEVRSRWAEVLAASGDVMPRFPLPLGDVSAPQRERVEVRDVLDVDDAAAFAAQAREDGVSTLSLVVSAMTAVTRDLGDVPLRAVFPVHSRYDATWHDSVGWFITNSVLESADPAPRACSAAVKEAIGLGSWPLEDILEPWGGMPEAPGMFAISWLDLRRLPVRIDAAGLEAQYVGAAVRTDGVMLWFVLDDAGLHLRCRYPDTPEARLHVGGWLDALVQRLRADAAASIGGRLVLGDRVFRVQRAARTDAADLVALLADDEIGRTREGADLVRYETAYDAIARDPAQYLAAVRDEGDRIVGTMQLTIVPGLSRGGTTRLQVEGVRVAGSARGTGLGTAMLEWAHNHGRARGATLAQLTTDNARGRAHEFYRRLGYEDTHVGFKRPL